MRPFLFTLLTLLLSQTGFSAPAEEVKDQKPDWQKFFKPPPPATETEHAEKKIQDLSEKNSRPEDLKQQGQLLYTLGRFTEAEEVFQRILHVHPENLEILLELAKVYLALEKPQKSFELLNQAQILSGKRGSLSEPFQLTYRYLLAISSLQNHDLENARAVLSDLIEQNLEFIPAYTALAKSFIDQEKYELAEFILRKALKVSENHSSVLNLMGVIKFKTDEVQEAQRFFALSLEKGSTVPAMINKAVIHLFYKEFALCQTVLDQAIALKPFSSEPYLVLGILLAKQGLAKEAEIAFQKSIQLSPESGSARYNLAVHYLNQNTNSTQAIQLLSEALQTKTDSDLNDFAQTYLRGLKNKRTL